MSDVGTPALRLAKQFNLSAKDINEAYKNDKETLEQLDFNTVAANNSNRKNIMWSVAIPILTLNPISLIVTLGTSQFGLGFLGLTGYNIYQNQKQKSEIRDTLTTAIARSKGELKAPAEAPKIDGPSGP